MGATTVRSRCTTSFSPFPLPKPPPPPPYPKQLLFSNYRMNIPHFSSSTLITTLRPRSLTSPETSVVEAAAAQEEESETLPDDTISSNSAPLSSLTGCKGCGREEIELGCNGEGRIQGGIATVPGFGWWPIKAYRPCPAFVASGGRYTRIGQSMDEVVSGRGLRDDQPQSRKVKKGPRKSKK